MKLGFSQKASWTYRKTMWWSIAVVALCWALPLHVLCRIVYLILGLNKSWLYFDPSLNFLITFPSPDYWALIHMLRKLFLHCRKPDDAEDLTENGTPSSPFTSNTTILLQPNFRTLVTAIVFTSTIHHLYQQLHRLVMINSPHHTCIQHHLHEVTDFSTVSGLAPTYAVTHLRSDITFSTSHFILHILIFE